MSAPAPKPMMRPTRSGDASNDAPNHAPRIKVEAASPAHAAASSTDGIVDHAATLPDHAPAGHPEGIARGPDPPAVRGGGPARAPRLGPRLPRLDRRRPRRAGLDPASAGDPALRPGRHVRRGDHGPGLDRRDRGRRRGADLALATRSRAPATARGSSSRSRTSTPRTRAKEMPAGSRISTEFVRLTERYFAELGIDVRVSWSYGATEAKVPEIVDAIVDVTETGSHAPRARHEDHRDADDLGPGAGGEPRGRRRPGRSAPRWRTWSRCCAARSRRRAAC